MICKSPARCISTVINWRLSLLVFDRYSICLRDNLYNTNSDFDWGAFRKLEEQLSLSWTPPRFFSVVLTQPGVYVFKLSSHPHRHMVNKSDIFSRPAASFNANHNYNPNTCPSGGDDNVKFITKRTPSSVSVSHNFFSVREGDACRRPML